MHDKINETSNDKKTWTKDEIEKKRRVKYLPHCCIMVCGLATKAMATSTDLIYNHIISMIYKKDAKNDNEYISNCQAVTASISTSNYWLEGNSCMPAPWNDVKQFPFESKGYV